MVFRILPPAAPRLTPAASGSGRGVHPVLVLAVVSLWMATAANLPLWQKLAELPELGSWRGIGFALALGVIVFSGLTALLSLLAWRWTLKPVLTISLAAAAAGAHFMLAYGVVIDPTMMVNVLQTDLHEARDLLSWRMVATVSVLAIVPALWLWRTPVRRLTVGRQLMANTVTLTVSLAVLSGTLLLVFQDFSSVMRNHTQLRYLINPLNSVYALGRATAGSSSHRAHALRSLGMDAHASTRSGKPPLLVLVLGETARAGNFALNGYERPTTPRLAGENVVSLRNVWSCGTSTAASVPCMFAHLGRDRFDSREDDYETLMDVLQHAGLAVLWVDNQSGCKGVCDRIPHASTVALDVPGLCEGGECFDEVMLHGLDQRIAALPAEQRARGVVVVLHQMGSHGPAYSKRSPAGFKKFLPECTSNALQECSREQLVNAYDNSIVYTDHFLASTIAWLKGQEQSTAPAMIYLSDHGESLGENNLYLHGLPYRIAPDVQKRVPWITWLSPSFERQRGLSTACLRQQLDAPLSHNHLFHSVLGVLGVQSKVYEKSLDLYAGCQTPA